MKMGDVVYVIVELKYLERLARRDWGAHPDMQAWEQYSLDRARRVQQAIDCLTAFARLVSGRVAEAVRQSVRQYQTRLDQAVRALTKEIA